MTLPETRHSLIVRLRDPADSDAWAQFVELYRPIMVRTALRSGLQRADADDLAQTVLVSVAGAVGRWEPSGRAKFRTWLKRITDNAILNALTRSKPDRASGTHENENLIAEHPDRSGPASELLKLEYRREILQWAAQRIRGEFSATTWRAFWLTAVEARPAEEVGRLLGRNRGGIYAARSRVMRRLLQEIREFDETEDAR